MGKFPSLTLDNHDLVGEMDKKPQSAMRLLEGMGSVVACLGPRRRAPWMEFGVPYHHLLENPQALSQQHPRAPEARVCLAHLKNRVEPVWPE